MLLVILSSLKQVKSYEKLVNQCTNLKQVSFIGRINEMPSKIAEYDAVVLPSSYREGLSKFLLKRHQSADPCWRVMCPDAESLLNTASTDIFSNPKMFMIPKIYGKIY